jgi:RNA polymerase sigma-70 factor (ECF subfamily)
VATVPLRDVHERVVTALLLLSAPNGDDLGDPHRVRRFHARVVNEPLSENPAHDPSRPIPEIAGIPVRALLTRLQQGDQSALTILYDALFDALWRVAVLQTHAGDLAEDIVHDVFLWLWTHRDTIAVTTDVRVYLATATRNRARNLGKHRQVVERATTADPNAAEAAGISQVPRLADASTDAADFLAAYQRALTQLTERELTAALLRWEEGFTLEAIGQVLGVSTMSAQRIVLRARDKVYEALSAFR